MRKIIFIMLAVLISSCGKKLIPIKETFHRSDTTIITEKIVPVNVPGSNVVGDLDSLVSAWGLLKEGRVIDAKSNKISIVDPTNQTKLTIFYDSLTKQLSAYCETLEKTYEARLQEKERIIHEQRDTIVKEQKSFGQQLKQIVIYFFVGIACLVILIIVLGVLVYRRTSLIPRP